MNATAPAPAPLDRNALAAEARARALKGHVDVPPYPAVALKLRRVIQDGNFGTSDLARVVGTDEALAATVLRLANSGFYRGVTQVRSLGEAVARIGAQELGRVALAASLAASAHAGGPLEALRRSCWRRSLASALCCQALAPSRQLDTQTAFLSGLLHDFGRIVAITVLEAIGGPTRLPEADWQAIVDDLHVQLGALIAERWTLPEALASVMAHHHEPQSAGMYLPLVALVTVADDVVGLAERCPYLLERDLMAVRGIRGLDEIDALMRMVPAIPAFIASVDELQSTPARPGAASAVEAPATTLGDPRRPVDFPVTWVRSNAQLAYRARAVSPDGLALAGKTVMFEGSVVRLRLDRGGGEAEDVSGHVTLSRPDAGGHYMEVHLYALPGRDPKWWEEMAAALAG